MEKDITLVNLRTPLKQGDLLFKSVPRGTLYIAAALEDKGFSVDFKDYQFCDIKKAYSIDYLFSFLNNSSDIIAISCLTYFLPYALLALEKIKIKRPDKKIILGGPGIHDIPKEIMEKFNFIDIMIDGEGEETIGQVVENLRSKEPLNKIDGITFREDNKIIVSKPKDRIKDIDNILPAYHLINMKEYDSYYTDLSRGCPYRCTFCNMPSAWNNKMVYRKPEKTIDEIKRVIDLLPRHAIGFCDNSFCLGREDSWKVLDSLKQIKQDLVFSISARINEINEKRLIYLKNCGCVDIFYGIESGSNDILKKIGKNFSSDEAIEKIKLTGRHIQGIIVSLMYNYPFEKINDFKKTVEMIIKLYDHYKDHDSEGYILIELNPLTPALGTKMYKNHRHELITNDFSSNVLINVDLEQEWDGAKLKKEPGKRILNVALPAKKKRDFSTIKSTIEENPLIFPVYYSYKTCDPELKEELLADLRDFLKYDFSDVLFQHKKKSYYFQETGVYSIGDDKDDAIIVKIDENMEGKYDGEKLNLIDIKIQERNLIDLKDNLSLILKKLNDEKIKFKIISPLPYCVTKKIKILSEHNYSMNGVIGTIRVDEKREIFGLDENNNRLEKYSGSREIINKLRTVPLIKRCKDCIYLLRGNCVGIKSH